MKRNATNKELAIEICRVKAASRISKLTFALLITLFIFGGHAGAQRIPPRYNPPSQYKPPPQYNPPPQYKPPPQYNPPPQYKPPQIVTVRQLPRLPAQPLRYEAYENRGPMIYRGPDVKELVREVNKHVGNKADNVYLRVQGFPNTSKTDGFLTSARIELGQINSNLALRFIIDRDRSPSWQDFFISPGVSLEADSFTGPYQLNAKRHAGFFYGAFTVSNEYGRGRIRVFAKTLEIVEAFIQAVRSLFESQDLSRMSVEQIVRTVRAKVKATHGLSEEDLEIQVGRTVISTIWKGYSVNLG